MIDAAGTPPQPRRHGRWPSAASAVHAARDRPAKRNQTGLRSSRMIARVGTGRSTQRKPNSANNCSRPTNASALRASELDSGQASRATAPLPAGQRHRGVGQEGDSRPDRDARRGRTSRAATTLCRPRREGDQPALDDARDQRPDSAIGARTHPNRPAHRRREPSPPSECFRWPSSRTDADCPRRTIRPRIGLDWCRRTCTSSDGSSARRRTAVPAHRPRPAPRSARQG